MALGAKELKSTMFTVSADGQAPSVVKPAPKPSEPDGAQSQSSTLITLTREGAFTSEELLDMLLHPEKKEEYVQKALARRGASPCAIDPESSSKKDPKLLWPQWEMPDESADRDTTG